MGSFSKKCLQKNNSVGFTLKSVSKQTAKKGIAKTESHVKQQNWETRRMQSIVDIQCIANCFTPPHPHSPADAANSFFNIYTFPFTD